MSEPTSSPRGGKRAGAGRKPGTGSYSEPTELIRVPVSLLPVVRAWLAGRMKTPPPDARLPSLSHREQHLPLFGSRVPAGLPSPADDHLEDSIDLHEELIHHPAATFFVRVQGESMTGAGIFDGDLLVIDRALEPKPGAVVVAVVDGELTVKRLKVENGRIWLMPENPAFRPLEIRDGMDLVIWGVVKHTVRSF
ncbi:LexA family transcriptional regulator [Methylococcus sp. EFPC2]|uniref:LexA family protein n=1 Tax=Methylococcus sp. EFPC2 TaxID=2812648 RepID=UPI0019683793|nr:translesion error-prone DNA polymerase V autoproteolytic subunit [Methylococcus sp. EFPC2]QSA96238.1 translesion error-prone DNA polymerase V autoproteolytic subunit [Methylococcus sp. EFPC2]